MTNQERDIELLVKARQGSEQAREALIRKYMPMVRHIVAGYCPYGSSEAEDMVQEGSIGLLDAVNEYDCGQDKVKFSSFAYLCVVRKIYNYIRRANNSKHRALTGAVSLQSYVDGDEGRTIMDLLSSSQPDPIEEYEEKWTSQRLRHVLHNHLSVFEYAVVVLLLRGFSLREIQRKVGVDVKSIDNARTRARAKLSRIMNRYGSLVSHEVPDRVRKRQDLYLKVRVTL